MAEGVTFEIIAQLAEEFPETRTEELCCTHIKFKTFERQCAFVDLLREQQSTSKLVGTATCFVSHAWHGRFADTVDCIRQYEESHPGTFFWIDVLCCNHHETRENPSAWWSTMFRENLRQIGSLLLVLSPWQDPAPLKRIWCLFELHCAASSHTTITSLVPHSDAERFREAVRDNFAAIQAPVLALDARSASAAVASDREQILQVPRSN